MHSYGDHDRNIGMNTTIKGGDSASAKVFGSTVNDSEEMILKGAGEPPIGNIVVTNDVRMEVHSGRSSS